MLPEEMSIMVRSSLKKPKIPLHFALVPLFTHTVRVKAYLSVQHNASNTRAKLHSPGTTF